MVVLRPSIQIHEGHGQVGGARRLGYGRGSPRKAVFCFSVLIRRHTNYRLLAIWPSSSRFVHVTERV
jgi:hypothetical protein